jgi:hypothetical protein
MPEIACPVLLQADPAAGGAMTDAEVTCAMPLLAQGRRVRLARRGHWLFAPDLEPVLRAVVEFFEQESAEGE